LNSEIHKPWRLGFRERSEIYIPSIPSRPGRPVSPATVSSCTMNRREILRLTSIDVLADHILDGALVRRGHGLLLDGAAAIIEALGLVHGTLKSIALPAEQIIAVSAVAAGVGAKAPHERVRVARLPHAVELAGIPSDLKGDLRHADRVGFRASGRVVEVIRVDSVIHVRLVVGAVKVLAVPASVGGQQNRTTKNELQATNGGKWWVVKIPPEQGFVGISEVIVPRLPPVMHW
jgi:hypothetical protein